ncbi:hypothetical protein ABK040_014218 [Willaertia magna]
MSLLKGVLREIKLGDGKFIVQVRKGDLTEENVDVIVNAANGRLQHISGLAGAIVKKGGIEIQEQSNKEVIKVGRELDAGEVLKTGSGRLPCKAIYHAVGPIWPSYKKTAQDVGLEQEDFELQMCVQTVLRMLVDDSYKSISIPAISSGIFGFPKPRCAKVLFNSVEEFINDRKGDQQINNVEIRFTNFDDETCNIFIQEFDKRHKIN